MGSSPSKRSTVWDPARYIDPAREDDRPFALLILNQEISDLELFGNIWANSSFRVCADGGANRLYTALQTDAARELMLPNAIVGDLDSLLPSIHAYYAAHGVAVIQDRDQDSTDFAKCLDYISQHTGLQSPEFEETHDALEGWRGTRVSATHSPIPVVAVGGWGGRVDQSLHSIQALHTAASTRPARRLTLVSSENITFLLAPGRNTILTPRHLLGLTCGILPIGGAAVITTQGLRWNMRDAETRFGGLVSTSNHLAAEEVVVETSESVVFTVEIRRDDGGGLDGEVEVVEVVEEVEEVVEEVEEVVEGVERAATL
ncbi:uncharacterized protein H6S33_008919 [Morchella sextelata]|uniref:uncharacterized protein n=1 Tax=Morchella sextelata TaxID=1174677 RepID=UPI001D042EF6|nr:uncharacterized protein H6S33_008919 [Morchella sextelata]KAH0612539.1 hypothetical protein H6S33_008919 [Morchella sextelata]